LDQIFASRQILEKKLEYNGKIHQLFIGFKKAYDSIKREKLYSILIRFGIQKKMVQLVKMCLKIRNGLKQGNALSPLLFNFALEYAILKIKWDKKGLSLNGLNQLFFTRMM